MLKYVLIGILEYLLLRSLLRTHDKQVEMTLSAESYRQLEGHTFSTCKEGLEMTWEINPLLKMTSELEAFDWEIPSDRILDSWVWGDDHISDHMARTLEADLSYPILLWQGEIVDGYHRVLKALLLGRTHVKARQINLMPTPDETSDCTIAHEGSSRHTLKDLYLVLREHLALNGHEIT